MYEVGSCGLFTRRACASRTVARSPSSLATEPTISASTRSALMSPGRATEEEKPSSTSMVPVGTSLAREIASRARFAASGFASIAYTFLAPARAAMSASSANGPVPMSSTTSSPSRPDSRFLIASSNSGVLRASSTIALYADSSKATKSSPLRPSVAPHSARSSG
eukprot:scaffold122431_cov30-Tisochrysis_lutea.AAC.4